MDDRRDDDGPNKDTEERDYGIRDSFQEMIEHDRSLLATQSITARRTSFGRLLFELDQRLPPSTPPCRARTNAKATNLNIPVDKRNPTPAGGPLARWHSREVYRAHANSRTAWRSFSAAVTSGRSVVDGLDRIDRPTPYKEIV